MPTLDLCVFSATGNTLRVAQAMEGVFVDRGWTVHWHAMESTDASNLGDGDMLGLAFPVACQSTYPLVWNFCKSLPPGNGRPCWMVDTLAMYSGGIVGPLRKVIEHKGYKPAGACEIVMPWSIRFWPTTRRTKARIRAGERQARRYARTLLAGKTRWGRIPVLSDLMRNLAAGPSTWQSAENTGKRLAADPDFCVRCGTCADICPTHTIELGEDGLPVFSESCQFCLRCLSFCPTHAIRLGKISPEPYSAVSIHVLRDRLIRR